MNTKTEPKGNKGKRNAQASKQRLLNAAIEVFARKGPGAATVDEISALAGLNKRLTYHYFGSKELLYKAALYQVYESFFSLEIELSAMLLPADELLETLVRRYYRFLDEHPDFVRMLCFENLNDAQAAREMNLQDKKAPIITALRLAQQVGQDAKRFRNDIDVADLLISIFSLCFFYFSNRYTMCQLLENNTTSLSNLDKRIKNVVALLLYGITAEKPDSQ